MARPTREGIMESGRKVKKSVTDVGNAFNAYLKGFDSYCRFTNTVFSVDIPGAVLSINIPQYVLYWVHASMFIFLVVYFRSETSGFMAWTISTFPALFLSYSGFHKDQWFEFFMWNQFIFWASLLAFRVVDPNDGERYLSANSVFSNNSATLNSNPNSGNATVGSTERHWDTLNNTIGYVFLFLPMSMLIYRLITEGVQNSTTVAAAKRAP